MRLATLPIVLGLIGLSAARTDLGGCVSSQTTNQWHEASMIWYVPESGEICDFPDCGGGRAPPKTDQPGCAQYSGTETLTPSYLPGYGPSGKMAATTSTLAETTSSSTHSTTDTTETAKTTETTKTAAATSGPARSMVTSAPTHSPVVSMSTKTPKGSAARSSTSSAPASSPTGNAAANSVSNIAGALAGVAAVLGAIAL